MPNETEPETIEISITGTQYRCLWEVDYESQNPGAWKAIVAAEKRRAGRGWLRRGIVLTTTDAMRLREYAIRRLGAAKEAGDHGDARAMDDLVDRIDDGFRYAEPRYVTTRVVLTTGDDS